MDDPLAGITLEEEDYRWVTQEICAVAERVRLAAAAALPEAATPPCPVSCALIVRSLSVL